ncbi:pseudouridine synthase [Pseudovibrio sp. Tun.PSC04-5.I4]|uniref:pseudouridine synthase n=1 Tax=Pseudovibrio sp. Tun.PSC04-5.I4 TaxID=1798213 RepID=UPI0008872556|nr:pseudouridine synthase [Pseudovibrio sp. Tun.PSC04-5.I4]SDQ86828.1 16S rRNA pseudouridine516 synthase [Pseudovibrio sp. Tun.PSC04-5.I4]
MRLVKLLANLGYGSRKEMQIAIRNGWVTDKEGNRLKAESKLPHEEILFDDEPLDPPEGCIILLNKPLGYTCSMKDRGRLVFDLLPERYRVRKPALSFVGRLDKDTTGLLLFTDNGKFLHEVISPKADVAKVYEVELDRPMTGGEADQFSSGELVLENDTHPLKPAELETLTETTARLTLHEGRYHQVRRMFAATGNHVNKLHRAQLGNLTLDGVEEGQWKLLGTADIDTIFGKDS